MLVTEITALTFIEIILFAGAVKLNSMTVSATKKDYESELQKWFGNARDRGTKCRKKNRTDSPCDDAVAENTDN